MFPSLLIFPHFLVHSSPTTAGSKRCCSDVNSSGYWTYWWPYFWRCVSRPSSTAGPQCFWISPGPSRPTTRDPVVARLPQSQCASKFSFEIPDSFLHETCASMMYHKYSSSHSYFVCLKILSILQYWCLEVLSLVGSAACVSFEQCKLLSACGVSQHLSFRQVQLYILLLAFTLQ